MKGVDLDAPGSINGVPLLEVDLDSFEDKPWRKPGKKSWAEIFISLENNYDSEMLKGNRNATFPYSKLLESVAIYLWLLAYIAGNKAY